MWGIKGKVYTALQHPHLTGFVGHLSVTKKTQK